MTETSNGPATLADIDGHYRVLLGRQPESAAVMVEMVGQDLQGLHTSFISSREFAERVFEPIVAGGAWPKELFTGAPDGALVRWIAEQFGLDDAARDRLDRARNWHLAHLLIFRDGSVLRQHGNPGLVAQLTAYLYGLNKILGRSSLAVDLAELSLALATEPVAMADAVAERDLSGIDLSGSRYTDRGQLHQDAVLLAGSDIFDESYYRWRSGIGADVDAVVHYLMHGWREGLDPAPHFDGESLRPFYASVGEDGPPALTFVMIQLRGWQAYPSVAAAQPMADVIRASDRFDADGYARAAGIDTAGLDPALHYLLAGERVGLAPSDRFDPVYYGRRNQDVVAHGSNLFAHYVSSGAREGRRPLFEGLRHLDKPIRLDPGKKTVLLTVHQASRTGAPILGLNMLERLKRTYNVVTLMMTGGELLDLFEARSDYVVGPLSFADLDATELAYLVAALLERVEVEYAIVNSIECRNFIPALNAGFVAVVTLMHEFACYTRPLDTMIEAMDQSSAMVFPAPVVRDSALDFHPWLKLRTTHILPQGPSEIPQEIAPEVGRAAERSAKLERLLRPRGAEQSLLVLGAGSIHLRKGVDLFIAAAAALAVAHPELDFRFVWIGHGYDPILDTPYSVYLAEQIARAGVKHRVAIIDEVDDLEPAYAAADLFFLSSRLDPLPNVGIDAALRGVPVICFDGGTGMADVLRTRGELAGCIVPYGDATAAAMAIAGLADPESRAAASRATRRLARATFDMDSYLASIDRLGVAGAEAMTRRRRDAGVIAADVSFDEGFFLAADKQMLDREAAIRMFCTQWDNVGNSTGAAVDPYFRRPAPGFHPQIFAQQAMRSARGNPFAAWVASGRPAGPWQQRVILPREVEPARLRAALHAHLYHPELIGDLLDKLAANRSRCDLFISTDREAKARALRTAVAAYGAGRAVVRVFPNRGRDVGPFFTGFRQALARYDVIGHVHSKRSEDLGSSSGDLWREFLWQHLLGDLIPAMDLALDAFYRDPALGLVYPADPHLSDWDQNRAFGDDLARRMGLDLPLPAFFDFPIGTMFWARRKGLQPMFDLALDWMDYPDEPLPYDGTLLHGLERMLPFAVARAGMGEAVVHLPGINR